MKIFLFKKILTNHLHNISVLYDTCELNDNITYERFLEDDTHYYDSYVLTYDTETLIGFLMYSYVYNIHEIRGLVHPDFRRKGIFTNMFTTIKSEHHFDDVIFVGKDNFPGIEQCAIKLGCTTSYHDFLMEFDSSLFTPSESKDLDIEFDESDDTYYYYFDDALIGSCNIYEEKDTINIYEVFVEPPYRNRRFGHQIISDVLWDLINSGKNIRLHVTETNTPAVSLYKSCGFIVKDSIIYYQRTFSNEDEIN